MIDVFVKGQHFSSPPRTNARTAMGVQDEVSSSTSFPSSTTATPKTMISSSSVSSTDCGGGQQQLCLELVSVLDVLGAQSLSSGSPLYGGSALSASLDLAATVRARDLCQSVQAKQRLVFQQGDGAVLRHVFHLVFSSSVSVRKGARMILEAAKEALPKDFQISEFVGELGSSGGRYHKWMLDEIAAGNVDGLKAWQITIRLLGKMVHVSSGTALLNTLLAIAEKGFKSEDILLRRETFIAWQVLIDNFAANEAILLHPKRIRLITRPLVANNNMNKEPLARAKFNTWWHFISRLGPNLVSNIDSVVIPFIEFCYGKSLSDSAPAPASKPHTPSSPVKKFVALSSQCLDAFAQILNCQAKNRVLKPLCVKSNLLESKDVIAHYQAILYAMTEALATINLGNVTDLDKFEAIFATLSNMIHSIESSDKPEIIKAVSFYLTSVHKSVMQGKRESRLHSVLLTMLEEVRKLPSNILFSKGYWSQLEQPMVTMLKLLLDRDLLPICSSDNSKLKKQYNTVLQGFLKKGCSSKINALPLLDKMTSQLEESVAFLPHAAARNEVMVSMWKYLSSHLKEHIDRHQEINQVAPDKSALEYNFGACAGILTFPLRHLAVETHRNLWKQWVDLYSQITAAAALVRCYKGMDLEQEVCVVMKQMVLKADAEGGLAMQQLDNFSKIFNVSVVKEIPFKSLSAESFHLMEPVVDVALVLVGKVSTACQSSDSAQIASNVCTGVSTLLSQSSSQDLLRLLLKKLVPSLPQLLSSELVDKLGRSYSESADAVLSSVLTLLQSRYKGSFDKELMQDILPFLEAVMTHDNRHIRQRALQTWQVTFAPSIELADIPSGIAIALRKSLVLSSESSQSTMSTDDDNTPGLSFGSFLSKEALASPSTSKVEPKETPSPFKNFRKPTRTRRKMSLEDESSQDFVPISSLSKKKRLLTEHQKEKLKTRSDDIPALYSELSRDDSSQVDLPAQFSSQMSQDDSSQAALDESEFQKHSNKEVNSREKLESSLHPTTTDQTANDGRTQSSFVEDPAPLVDLVSSSETDGESPAESSRKKRKGRPPIKNLLPFTKRQQPDTPGSSEVPAKKPRGRPAKAKKIEAEVASDQSDSAASSPSVLKTNQDYLVTPAEVKLARLSPNQDSLVKSSPVKVITENPLVITSAEAAQPDTSEDDAGVTSGAVPKVRRELDGGDLDGDADMEIIESSQSSEETMTRGRKRRRESSNATLSDKSTNSKIEEGGKIQKPQKAKRSFPLRGPADKENLVASQQQQQQLAATSAAAAAAAAAKSSKAAKNQYGETPLHVAVKKGDLAKVQSLLEKGADVHARDNAGWTPIHESIRENPQSLAIIKALIDAGANVNVQADDGNSPLHDACTYMSDKMIQLLIDKGADTNLPNKVGLTPMVLAPTRLARFLEGRESPQTHGSPRTNMPAGTSDRSPSAGKTGALTAAGGPSLHEVMKGIEPINSTTDVETTESPPETSTTPSMIEKDDDASESSSIPSIPLLPFTRIQDKPRRASLLIGNRGAKLLEMSKAKGIGDLVREDSSHGGLGGILGDFAAPVMSPRVTVNQHQLLPVSGDNLTTPTSQRMSRPWEKFQPSPSDASPSVGILKKSFSEGERDSPSAPPPFKRRRVQFMEPPVSERVEIPRCASGGPKTAGQRLVALRFPKDNNIPLVKTLSTVMAAAAAASCEESQEESTGLYEATPPVDVSAKDPIYPSLVDCDEPVTSILTSLANLTWQKAAEKSLTDNGITKISELSRLTPLEAQNLKGIKPPNNVATIQCALRKFERKRETRLSSDQQQQLQDRRRDSEDSSIPKKFAPVFDVTTAEEDDQTMKELYERPSPSPTELGGELPSDDVAVVTEPAIDAPAPAAAATGPAAASSAVVDIGLPPPLICLHSEKAAKSSKAVEASEPYIPTIVQQYTNSSPSKRATSTPREQWSLSQQDTPSKISDQRTLVHRECQVSSKKAETAEVECSTDERELISVEVQAVAASLSKEVQTRPSEKEEDFAYVMEKLDTFDAKILVDVMSKCVRLMGNKC